jgi:uncharacterized protein (DUF58 family)
VTGSRARPVSLHRPAAVLILIGAMLYVVARATGSGWLVVILSGLIPVVVVGVLWPVLALGGVTVAIRGPRDATVGSALILTVTAAGRGRSLTVRIDDPVSGWVRVDAPCRGEVRARPTRRGVLDEVGVQLRCAAPLGFVSWRRRVRVSLDQPLEVGPAPIPARYWRVGAAEPVGEGGRPAAGRGTDAVRGARDYVDGDALRLVHWPATARRGGLMVRELEDPRRPRLVLVVDLRGPPAQAEEAASRAAGVANAALLGGVTVELRTAERDGPRVGVVASPVETGRRLARAVAGPPPDGPVPASVQDEVAVIAADGPGGRP